MDDRLKNMKRIVKELSLKMVQWLDHNVLKRIPIEKFKKKITGFIKRWPSLRKELAFTRLDRYVLIRFIYAYLGSLFMFLFIFQLTQIFQDMRWLPQGTNYFLLFQHYIYSSFFWMLIFQPFGFLFATVYVLSRMAHHRELVAVISTGSSMYRATFYLLAFTIFYYFLNIFILMDFVIMPSHQKKILLFNVIFNKMDPKNMERLKDNRNFSIFGSNRLIYIVSYYNAVEKTLENITIVRMKSPNSTNVLVPRDFQVQKQDWILTNLEEITKKRNLIYPENVNIDLRIDADRGYWDSTNENWIFNIGKARHIENSGESFRIESFSNRSFDYIIDPPFYFEKQWYGMDAMTYAQGKRYIDKLKKSHQDYKEDLARYYSKFSYPIGMIFIVLAGIGIVDLSRRKISFIANLMMCLGLFVVYYVFFAMGISLSGKGDLPPIIGAYAGSAFFGIVSIYLYSKVKT